MLEVEVEPNPAMSGKVVILSYQSFCDPCGSTKPHLEALAKEHGFHLVNLNRDADVDWNHAGRLIPAVSIYRNGILQSRILRGAQTRKNLVEFLTEYEILKVDAT